MNSKQVVLLHGAIKNAGDFLIAHRAKQLLQKYITNANITCIYDSDLKDNTFAPFLQADLIVLGGGPLFTQHIYSPRQTPRQDILQTKLDGQHSSVPLLEKKNGGGIADIKVLPTLSKIKAKIMNIGGGFWGKTQPSYIHNYQIDDTSATLLQRIIKDSGVLATRGWYTVDMLKAKGLPAIMTGCPAWYDMAYIEKNKLNALDNIKRVCISDCSDLSNLPVAIDLIKWTRQQFKNAQIYYVFHRGAFEETDFNRGKIRKLALQNVFKECDIKYINIAGDYKGFDIYDTCQLHIGFRVHAHIYNLSHRNATILLEEDGRGAEVNCTLGIKGVCLYDTREQFAAHNAFTKRLKNKLLRTFWPYKNQYAIQEVQECLNRLYDTKGLDYNCAFEKMQFYYKVMVQHILKNATSL